MGKGFTEENFWDISKQIIFPYIIKNGQLDAGVYGESDDVDEEEISWAFNTMIENNIIEQGDEPDIFVLTELGEEYCEGIDLEVPLKNGSSTYSEDDNLIRLMVYKTFIFYRQNPIKNTSIELMKYKPGFEFLSKHGTEFIEKLEQHLQAELKKMQEEKIISIEEGDKSMVDLNAPTIPDIVTLIDESRMPNDVKQEFEEVRPIMEKEAMLMSRISVFNYEPYQRERNRIFMGRDTTLFNERLETLIGRYNAIEDELEKEHQEELDFIANLPESLREEYQEKSEHYAKMFERELLEEKLPRLRAKFEAQAEIIREKERQKELKHQKKHKHAGLDLDSNEVIDPNDQSFWSKTTSFFTRK